MNGEQASDKCAAQLTHQHGVTVCEQRGQHHGHVGYCDSCVENDEDAGITSCVYLAHRQDVL